MSSIKQDKTLADFLVDLNKAAIEPLLIEEDSDSLEVTSKQFEIMFDIKLYTSTEEESSIYIDNGTDKPKITVDYFKKDVKDYKSFNNLESLTDNFYKKIKDERNPSGKLQFLSVFRSNYKPTGGASADSATPTPTFYELNIQYNIAIKLQISKRKTIAQEYLLKIIELKTVEVQNLDNKTTIQYVGSNKNYYDFELKGLKQDDQDKIKENIKKILDSKKENAMINLNMESPTSDIPELIGHLSENTYDISKPPEDENYSEWLDYAVLERLKQSITIARSMGGMFSSNKIVTTAATAGVRDSSEIDLEIVKEYIYKLLGYEFLRIDRLLMIFNTDIFIKLFSILSNGKYVSKYTEILKFVYLRINIKNLEKIYEKPNKIYDIIDANTGQYDKLLEIIESNIKQDQTVVAEKIDESKVEKTMEEVVGGSSIMPRTSFKQPSTGMATTGTVSATPPAPADSLTDPKYIFSYLLFKKLFNDFFGGESSNANYSEGYTSITGMGSFDDNVKPLRIMLVIILKIEKNVLSILDIFRENLGILKNIDKDFVNLSTEIKKVVSIVKRRHDYYEYDETHPLYKTKQISYPEKLHYLDVYYINNPELKELFTYYDPYGRFKLGDNTDSTDETDKTELNYFRTKFGYNSRTGDKVLSEDKPDYFYEKETSQVQGGSEPTVSIDTPIQSPTKELGQLISGIYNERHKFGPFDYLYNQDKVLNSKIAEDIGPQLTKQLEGNTIMMNGFGQSGSGKTSTLIKLVTTTYSEDGVLIEYLKKLGGKISSIKIECVNLYYQELDDKPIGMYEAFTKENYSVEIYGPVNDVVKKDLRELNQSNGEKLVSQIEFTNLDNYNATISNVGDEILKLFERRQVLPTPNNDKSSRSHIIICLTFGAVKANNETFITDTSFHDKKIIVCDLAGVENEFKCANQQELMKFDVKYDILLEKKKINDKQAISALDQLKLVEDLSGAGHECFKKSIEFLRDTKNFGTSGYNFDVIKGIDNFPDIIKMLTAELEKTKTKLESVKAGTSSVDDEDSTTTYVDNIKNLSKLLNLFIQKSYFNLLDYDSKRGNFVKSNPINIPIDIVKTWSMELNPKFIDTEASVISKTIQDSNVIVNIFKGVNDILKEIQNAQTGIDNVERELADLTAESVALKEKKRLNIEGRRKIDVEIIELNSILSALSPIKKSGEYIKKVVPKKTFPTYNDIITYNTNVENLAGKKINLEINSHQFKTIEADILTKTTEIATKTQELATKTTENTTDKLVRLINTIKESLIENLKEIQKIEEKKAADSSTAAAIEATKQSDIELLTAKQAEYELVIECVKARYVKIQLDCSKRLKEGYMINRSLTELSKGISKIVEETASNGGLPIYIDKQIDPKCRNNFLDYYTFDQFSKESATIEDSNIMKNYEKYGVILCILKYHYKIDLNKLVFYNLLVYNTSFFSKSSKIYTKQGTGTTINKDNTLVPVSYPKRHDENFGDKNNPPDPPYVNINILKYFTKIHKNKSKLEKILDLFGKYVNKYEFYKKNALPLGDSVFEKAETWIKIIERNNSATLIGTLEATDLLQTVAFKDVGCNLTFESTDQDYKEMIVLFNSTTNSILTNCKNSLAGSINIYFANKGSKKDPKLDNLKTYINDKLFKERTFNGTIKPTAAAGGGKTLRKHNTKRKTIKRKILKTRRLYRKTKLRRTHKKY